MLSQVSRNLLLWKIKEAFIHTPFPGITSTVTRVSYLTHRSLQTNHANFMYFLSVKVSSDS